MNVRTVKTIWRALAAVAVLAPTAHAQTVAISLAWTDEYNDAETAAFTVALSPIGGSPGEFDAVSISGTYEGQTITGLSDFNLGDNIVYAPSTGMAAVDGYGLSFAYGLGGDGLQGNLWNDGVHYIIADYTPNAFDSNTVSSASFDFSGVPEPVVWALMLVGVSLTGGAMRTARKRRNTQAAA